MCMTVHEAGDEKPVSSFDALDGCTLRDCCVEVRFRFEAATDDKYALIVLHVRQRSVEDREVIDPDAGTPIHRKRLSSERSMGVEDALVGGDGPFGGLALFECRVAWIPGGGQAAEFHHCCHQQ